jgi:selenocysteine lyase/cysteine desulfurase
MSSQLIYLNNAATSWPKPDCVAKTVAAALKNQPGSANRGGLKDLDVFQAVRKRIAALIGAADPSQIALGPNATWALNLAMLGYPLEKGDTVLTDNSEHNSVLRPLHTLAKEKGIKVYYLPVRNDGRIEENA